MNTPESRGTRGILYVVATPIGNLEDITFRAVRILKEVSLIAAEDTRHSRKLLAHYSIQTPLVSCHEHNESSRLPEFIEILRSGRDIALVSDAGTPSISDPGYRLARACAEAGFSVIPIPGPSAVTAGLSVSGLPTDTFTFVGFVSRKQGRRRAELAGLRTHPATLIIYESPRRLIRLIEELADEFGPHRQAMLAREISKLHEEYLRGTLQTLLSDLKAREQIRGECALFVKGYDTASDIPPESDLDQEILASLDSPDMKTSKLAKALAKKYNLSKNEVYQRIVSLQEND